MKKLTALGISTAAYLSLVIPAFASGHTGTQTVNINLCAGSFSSLCALTGNNIGTIINSVVIILFIVATIAALVFLIYGGIKWITSGGDKTKVEGARNMIVASLVGLVLVFLSYFILNLIMNFFGLDILSGNLEIPNITSGT